MKRTRPVSGYPATALVKRLAQARGRLRALIDCLPEGGWLGPRAEHLNPPLWEYGHIVWFQERWCLRVQPDGDFAPSLLDGADALYDSSGVAHDLRWDLPLPRPTALDAYAERVAGAVAERLARGADDEIAYYAELSLYHELMHVEAWWMAFQNLGYAPPAHAPGDALPPARRLTFDAGEVALGSGADAGFIFDNEKWRHRVPVAAFDIDAAPVSETSFTAFVDAGGYRNKDCWSDAGWAWREAAGASQPLYWRGGEGGWRVRRFDRWDAPKSDAPMLHVNRFEAEACAAWMGRRLPDAAEWVRATTHSDFRRGMAWDWLRDPFAPYPGFSPDPYRDYSRPWFDTHWELRGGGPFTDAALKRPGYRNFYMPHRRDPFAGFRTASVA